MSCQGCHVNPAGGGLRTASGRYYSQSTLPMFGARLRPYRDSGWREVGTLVRIVGNTVAVRLFHRRTEDPPARENSTSQLAADTTVPATPARAARVPFFYREDPLSMGRPLNVIARDRQSVYALDRHRYGGINADPLLTIGADVRPALYVPGGAAFVFPMQVDVGASLHPVEHVTAAATFGLQARTAGLKASFRDPANKPLKLQSAYLLIHELPFMSYVQAGAFLPEFGLRMEDHTLFGEKYFESDHSLQRNLGEVVQFGCAPNYPYFSASAFRPANISGGYSGIGYALNAAWRAEKWGIGASLMGKQREFVDGGNLLAGALNGYMPLWTVLPKTRFKVPVLVEAEYVVAQFDRTVAHRATRSSWLLQADYQVINGLSLRTNHLFIDQDWLLKDDSMHRIGFGVDLTFVKGVRLSPELRVSVPTGKTPSADFLVFMHLYL
jgi:hypothetical protein